MGCYFLYKVRKSGRYEKSGWFLNGIEFNNANILYRHVKAVWIVAYILTTIKMYVEIMWQNLLHQHVTQLKFTADT